MPSSSEVAGEVQTPPKPQSLFVVPGLSSVDTPDTFFVPPPPPPRAFVHTTVAGQSAKVDTIEFPWYWSRLDHPELNGNPIAVISVTPLGRLVFNDEERTASIQHNPHAVGVIYRQSTQRWYIYNLNLAAMARASFNVVIEERYR